MKDYISNQQLLTVYIIMIDVYFRFFTKYQPPDFPRKYALSLFSHFKAWYGPMETKTTIIGCTCKNKEKKSIDWSVRPPLQTFYLLVHKLI